jgi:hypothetical protein
MKKTKYNKGGLTGNLRGNTESGVDYELNSEYVTVRGQGKGDSSNLATSPRDNTGTNNRLNSVIVRDRGNSVTVTKTPTSTFYGAEVNGKRVSYTDSQGHKQLEGGAGKYNAGIGKNSSGDVNAHVGYNGKNYNARVSKDQRGTSVNVGARKGNFSAEAGKGPDGSSVRLTYSKDI